jgi:hypothetical protein
LNHSKIYCVDIYFGHLSGSENMERKGDRMLKELILNSGSAI